MRVGKFLIDGALNAIAISSFVFLFGACSDSTSSGNDDVSDGSEETQNPSTTIKYGKPVTYDGQTYKTVIIGTQRWFAENLNYYDASDTLFTNHSWCPDNEPENCTEYGRLYDYYALMNIHDGSVDSIDSVADIQGICPEGWHVPTNSDWTVLMQYVGMQHETLSSLYYIDAGMYLKSINGWDGAGMDAYGFNALSAGYMQGNTYYSWRTLFWASNRSAYIFSQSGRNVDVENKYLEQGLSVRCVANSLVSTAASHVEFPGYVEPGSVTEGSFTYEGQTYKTVTIGSQTWFAENLNYYDTTESQLDSSWCYGNLPENCKKYGRLYNYPAAVSVDNSYSSMHIGANDSLTQGVCPVGWHISRSVDWDILGAAIGDNWNNGIKGVNKYGLNVSASGAYIDGSFVGLDSTVYLWTSTRGAYVYSGRSSSAYEQQFFGDSTNDLKDVSLRTGAYIRCVKDADFFSGDYGVCTSRIMSVIYGDSVYDPRDKKKYRVTTIGDQTWFAENLAYATGSSKSSLNSTHRGLLYKWFDAMQLDTAADENWAENIKYPHQGVCPLGWHIPTHSEWIALDDYISLTTDSVGYYLKSKVGWVDPDDSTANGNGIDFYGFNMMPEGMVIANVPGRVDYNYVNIWSSTIELTTGYYRFYTAQLSAVSYKFSDDGFYNVQNDFNPVRCLKDSEE